MNKLYVRVAPKSGNTEFWRCALFFTLAWVLVTVDDATKKRLLAEQMLEVSETKPEGYVDPDDQAAQEAADAKAAQEAADAKAAQDAADAKAAQDAADAKAAQDAADAKAAQDAADAKAAQEAADEAAKAGNYATGESTAAADALAEQTDKDVKPAAPAAKPKKGTK